MTVTIARSALTTSLLRYSRSWGLWLLLLVGPVGARWFIGRDDGQSVAIAINGHLPVLTSAVVGVSLGVVVSTLLLPIGFIYLRSNTTRRQPWQVEEVTAGSRVAIALGRFAADVAVFFALLGGLTFAGWILAWLALPAGTLDVATLTAALWVVAGPALMGLAAIRILFDALPPFRRGLGDFVYFVLWMVSIIAPAATTPDSAPGFAANLVDFPGFVRPLSFGIAGGTHDLAIGGVEVLPGRVPLDVVGGILSQGYIASRLAWVGIAVALAAFAGLVCRPHRATRRTVTQGRIARWLSAGAPPAADPTAPAARSAAVPLAGLVAAEFRLIGAGRMFKFLAAAVAVAAFVAADFRHAGSPAALLLLIFGLTAHAGRSEARGLLALTTTTATPPLLRRAAFIVAGVAWSLLLALPAVPRGGGDVLVLAATTGTIAALVAIGLSTVSRSAFAPRLILLIAWYGYLSGR